MSSTATPWQQAEPSVDRINRSGRQPVLFIHGLWLLPSSWSRWASVFEDAGFETYAPAWPGDDITAEAARADLGRPSETLEAVVGHLAHLIGTLHRKPFLVGHSFGGLIAQLLADRGLSAATVAISPPAFRGILPLPISALRSASPVLRNPANRHHVVPLTLEQFHYSFGNALSETEARQLYEEFVVPAPGGPLFEAAFANINPWTDDRLDPTRADRGPLLLLAGENDHVVPPNIVEAEYAHQRRNRNPTELRVVPGRGHSLTIDDGWKDVANAAVEFLLRFSDEARRDLPRSKGLLS